MTFPFFGIHEVRLLGPTGVSAGYFDNGSRRFMR